MITELIVRPIKTEQDHQRSLAEIERIFDAELNTPEGDRLDILVTLVEAYEKKHYPISPPHPVAMLEHYLDSRGLEQSALDSYLGGPSEVVAILNRERPLTLDMIRRLHNGLGISADVLIQPYPLLKAA